MTAAARCAHWGTHGAAGLLVVGKGKVLLQLRSQGVREPHTWSIPGGARGKDETAAAAALREAREETGLDPQAVKIVSAYTAACECSWTYTTLIANLVGTLTLRENWESQELRWVPLDDVGKLDLHPGLRAAWADLRGMLKADDTKPNITRITDQLWTGGDRGRTSMATWLAQLQSAGITAVIDCRPHGRADQAYAQAHAPQIGYLFNPQHDVGQKMPDWWFVDGVDFALHAMRDPAAKVLAHCQLGINRGPSMAFAILLATGMTPEQVRSTIVSARPIARIAYADDATKWWAKLTAPEPEVFYHGGPPGLHVGDMLLPATITGARTSTDRVLDANDGHGISLEDRNVVRQMYRRREAHRVFVTKDLMAAAYFAKNHHGDVYQVEPLGNLADTTSMTFSETTCASARIVAVVMKGVTFDKFILAGQEELARRKAIR
jgi:8-oxo-dGTP pyrophosphatase MutT (NUDIX family)